MQIDGRANQPDGAQGGPGKGSKTPSGSDALVMLARILARLAAAEAIRNPTVVIGIKGGSSA